MTEIERREDPTPTVIPERDGTRIGFAINGGDPAQEGAAIRVTDIDGIKSQLEASGVNAGESRVDERDGKKLNVFLSLLPMAFATTSTSQSVANRSPSRKRVRESGLFHNMVYARGCGSSPMLRDADSGWNNLTSSTGQRSTTSRRIAAQRFPATLTFSRKDSSLPAESEISTSFRRSTEIDLFALTIGFQ